MHKAIKLSIGALLHHMSASEMKEEWPIYKMPSCGWIESGILYAWFVIAQLFFVSSETHLL